MVYNTFNIYIIFINDNNTSKIQTKGHVIEALTSIKKNVPI